GQVLPDVSQSLRRAQRGVSRGTDVPGTIRAGETRLRRTTGKTRALQEGIATAGGVDRVVRGVATRGTERIELSTQSDAHGDASLGLGLSGGGTGRFGASGAAVGGALRQGREDTGKSAAARSAVPRHGGVEIGGGTA